jgi:hypothetical protein
MGSEEGPGASAAKSNADIDAYRYSNRYSNEYADIDAVAT